MRKANRTYYKTFTFSAGDQFTNKKERQIKKRGGAADDAGDYGDNSGVHGDTDDDGDCHGKNE